MQKKTSKFRELLNSSCMEFICEAHNGLSAKIVEEAGFKGIWGSGLSLAAQFGVRDNNEASWTQVLDTVEFMADASTIPIMLDGDTGYGNFNNVQRLVRKLEQRGVAAVCIEDKLFPKTNSFISGKQQPLADIDEFCGKIKAGKDAQLDPDFSIVARVEAFIAGWGLNEALRRAKAYHAAGADAILIHSALSVPDEILAFVDEWANRLPVVIVPTKYYATPMEVFEERGVSLVIWANQILRASVAAMQHATRRLFEERSSVRVEAEVVSVAEIFRLQGADDLVEAELRYLPKESPRPAAIVLAAARGDELGELTADIPKSMVAIGNMPLLAHVIATYNAAGVKDISVVRGYRKEAVNLPGVTYVDNDDHAETGELVSLWLGLARTPRDGRSVIVSYGDVLFRKYILDLLMESQDGLVVVVDTGWRESANRHRIADYVRCNMPYSRLHYSRTVFLECMDASLPEEGIHGEWMGFLKIGPEVMATFSSVLHEILASEGGNAAKMPSILNAMIARGVQVRVIYTTGNWLDIDSVEDVVSAGAF